MIQSLSTRVIAIIIAAVLVVAVAAVAFHFWQKSRSQGAQSRVEQGQAGAASNSAADAVGTVAASGANAAASEQLTRENERNIRAAQGANDPVNPAARDAGLAALCKRQAYANDPSCKEGSK